VLAVLAVCALLVSPVPLRGLGAVLLLVLAVLDVVLVAATGGLAFARAASLDERQVALRDLAYRRGFRLLGLGIVLAVIASFAGAYVVTVRSAGGALSQVDSGFSGRVLVAISELVVMLPTLVVAWNDRSGGGAPSRAALLAVPAVAGLWLAAVGWTPAQAAGASRNFGISASAMGSTCGHVVGGRIVGGGFGATVGMRVEVCWNGRTAFVIGDPAIALPAGVMADPDDRFLTACGADNVDDFATVTGTTCTAAVDPDGTLHYTVRAHVAPWWLPIGGRDVVMQLVVTRDGRVLSRP
jgi:hypothetical protein